MSFALRIRNASQVVLITSKKLKMLRGSEMNNIEIIQNGTIVVGKDGLIQDVGPEQDLAPKYQNATFEMDFDATGMSIIPGFVDAHTHPVWSGDRVHEFALKLAGATYMDIHKMGGGIGFTVQKTRSSSFQELKESLLLRLNRMIRNGTTVIEAKSGYGLDVETEMKMLKVLHEADKDHPIDIISTFLGAHSIPKGSTPEEATKNVIEKQLPELEKLKKEGQISPRNIDVFLEKGVFEEEDSRKIMEEGKKYGLLLNFHGDELHPMKSGELGADLGAKAISHLEHVDEEGMIAMAKANIVGVLLPTTAYILRLQCPPARKMIEHNVPIALGSDFNPNAHCMSMPFVMNLACVTLKMTMNESLVAATLNAAASLDLSDKYGSIEVGKYADFVLINDSNWEHIIYELVDPPIHSVFKKGKLCYQNSEIHSEKHKDKKQKI